MRTLAQVYLDACNNEGGKGFVETFEEFLVEAREEAYSQGYRDGLGAERLAEYDRR